MITVKLETKEQTGNQRTNWKPKNKLETKEQTGNQRTKWKPKNKLEIF